MRAKTVFLIVVAATTAALLMIPRVAPAIGVEHAGVEQAQTGGLQR